MKKHPTIDDVAKIAGVAKSTVSRALNDSSRISSATKQKVLEIADEIGFEPSNIARSLSTRRTRTIGVLVEDIVNSFFTEVAKGVETVLKKAGYTMILTSSDYNEDEELRLIRVLVQNKVDGVLLTPIQEYSDSIAYLKSRHVPFFIMNNHNDDDTLNWVDTDNFEGGYIGTKYLVGLNHRRFLCTRYMKLQGTRERFRGFCKALDEKNIDLNEQIIFDDINTQKDAYHAMNHFIAEHGADALPSAVIAVNDAVAFGIMESFLENNIEIPERVSLLGYDDINIAGLVKVPLTTVHQPKFSMGEVAAYMLVNRIEGKSSNIPQNFLLKPRLIIRESCRENVNGK